MKVFIAIALALVAAAAAAEWTTKSMDDIKRMRMEYIEEIGLSDELKDRLKKWELPSDKKVMEVIRCTGKKAEIWDDEKGFNKERLAKIWEGKIKKDDLEELLDECLKKKDDKMKAEEWAWTTWKCMLSNGKVEETLRKELSWK